jgi:hypothetical protein
MSQSQSRSVWALPLWVILYCIALWIWALVAAAYAVIVIAGVGDVGEGAARTLWATVLAGGSLALLVSGVGVLLRQKWGIVLSGLFILLTFAYLFTTELLRGSIGAALVRLVIGVGLAAYLVYLWRAIEPSQDSSPGSKGG